jgi:hypothetical protein
MATKQGAARPHLLSNEQTLLEYAADDARDIVTLSDKEALVLQLASQIQEQQLEKALLEQGTIYYYAGGPLSPKSFCFLFLCLRFFISCVISFESFFKRPLSIY